MLQVLCIVSALAAGGPVFGDGNLNSSSYEKYKKRQTGKLVNYSYSTSAWTACVCVSVQTRKNTCVVGCLFACAHLCSHRYRRITSGAGGKAARWQVRRCSGHRQECRSKPDYLCRRLDWRAPTRANQWPCRAPASSPAHPGVGCSLCPSFAPLIGVLLCEGAVPWSTIGGRSARIPSVGRAFGWHRPQPGLEQPARPRRRLPPYPVCGRDLRCHLYKCHRPCV